MRILSALVFLVPFLALAPAPAALAANCTSASNQHDLTVCADQAYKKTDATLNDLYGQIKTRLKGDDATVKLLATAQRAWIAFRDAECTFATASTAQGSIHPMLRLQCLDTLTTKRVEDFKVYLKCEEGDLSCPVPAQ
jgi:uncharacterized protein YecT (DUF1311 family)